MFVKMSMIPGNKEGTVGKISAKVGDVVKKGDVLAQVETAKGNRPVKATVDAKIKSVLVEEGDKVKTNAEMFELSVEEKIEEIKETVKEVVKEVKEKVASKETSAIMIKMSMIPGNKEGTVGKISAKVGDSVKKGDVLAQVETAKGNRPVKATANGVIKAILVDEGGKVKTNSEMFSLNQASSTEPTTKASQLVKNSSKKETDLLIIGAGPGGYVAALAAAKRNLKVTLIEKAELGGTCLNVGCIPTKALIKSGEVCHSARMAAEFGVKIDGDIIVDLEAAVNRKDQVKGRLVNGIDMLLAKNNIDLICGEAAFVSEKEVKVVAKDEEVLVTAKDIIIATGSKVATLPIPGIDLPMVLDSTAMLANTKLPTSLTIIGGGVIGMEFAFLYRNFGVEIHVVEYMDQILSMFDKDVCQEITDMAKDAGIHVHTGAKVTKIQQSIEGEAIVNFETKDGEQLVVSELVLSAVGRNANIDNLDLEKSGVKFDDKKRGIAVDSHMRTNVEHIYAIGDVTNMMQLAHVASHQGMVAVENILGNDKEMDYHAVPNVVFSHPEIASVGIGEDEAKDKGMNIKVSKFAFAGNGKALTMNEEKGFIKLVKDLDKNNIIGATIIGPDASSLIAAVTIAVNKGLNEEDIAETIFAHPTTSEVIHEAALDLGFGALHA
ncbi:dihydrolipoamide dehydrogenase [Granulicatella balaenopterae]|uniref:Dihydrolipoyl dehydrogenase n=1 Tax=Granulicatella balaenopterae TaxID=137733 RepID=A0A1H9MCF7_9LACT|nr:dihydrolipoyl dehydrogenase [Granulicatella balaenopterae]SER21364.1 dihydrolipoamide dehydrogenase [Granulicatella balaenopterae]